MKRDTVMILLLLWIGMGLGISLYLVGSSPFYPPVQEGVFQRVADLMLIDIDPTILKPKVVRGSDISDEENDKIWGFKVGGKRSPVFDWRNNRIVLHDESRIDSLAHEYTHYFQYWYAGEWCRAVMEGRAYDANDMLESQAINVQNNFR